MKKKKRSAGKIIALVILACVLAGVLFTAYGWGAFKFKRDEALIDRFYKEPEGSLDGVVVGSSASYRYWVSTEAYERTGMAVYGYGTVGMPVGITSGLIDSIIKTQHPKFIAVELRSIVKNPQIYNTGHIRNAVSYQPPSIDRLKIIAKAMVLDIKHHTPISKNPLRYKFPEDCGKRESAEKAVAGRGRFKGFVMYGDIPLRYFEKPEYTTESEELEFGYEEDMDKLIEYCKKADCEIVFFATPWVIPEQKQKQVNRAIEKIEAAGFDVIDMNNDETVEAIGLDFSKDMKNARHVNIVGAIKVTDYLADIFKERFDTEDHRGDANYASWDAAAEDMDNEAAAFIDRLNKKVAKREKKQAEEAAANEKQ